MEIPEDNEVIEIPGSLAPANRPLTQPSGHLIERKKTKKSSNVWTFFKHYSETPEWVNCSICGKNKHIGAKRSTSSMMSHIRSKHADEYKILLEDDKSKSEESVQDGIPRKRSAESDSDDEDNGEISAIRALVEVNKGSNSRSNSSNKRAKADAQPTTKRTNALLWDDYFMAVSFLSAMRSKDPSTQVGACIVDKDKRIVGIGYNGFPRGCDDDALPWNREASNPLDTKYPYVCHAEVNAILNKNSADVKGCSMYVALFPCNECAKMIIQSGINEVVYLSDKYRATHSMQASRKMMTMAGLCLRQYTPQQKSIAIDFSKIQAADPSL